MTKKKISNILDLQPGSHEEELLDNLATRIFLPNFNYNEIKTYYVKRTNFLDINKIENQPISKTADNFQNLPEVMGLYEKKIWNLIAYPTQDIIFLIGGIGSGKTTTISLITQTLDSSPTHCGNAEKCQGGRLHILMDFNNIDYMHESSFEIARSEFVKDLSERMSANLDKLEIEDSVEYVDFWADEIKRQQRIGIGYAFAKIVNIMKYKAGPKWKTAINHSDIDRRKEVKKDEIEKEPTLRLDYLCRFWNYILLNIYKKNRMCISVIIDNFDSASPALQAAVRYVITSYAERFGNTFLICLRPETELSKPTGVGSKLIHKEFHCGPSPFDVINDRLRKFIESPEEYFRLEEYLLRKFNTI